MGRLFLFFVGLYFSSIAFAGHMGKPGLIVPWAHPMIALSGGPGLTQTGKEQSFFVTPEIFNNYRPNHKTQSLYFWEAFIGWQRLLTYAVTGQLGLAFVDSGTAKPSGEIWREGNSVNNDQIYHYKINHKHLAAKGKLIGTVYPVQPYLSASVGIGMNKAYDFRITELANITPDLNLNFTSHRTPTVSFTVGLGIQKAFNQNWQANVGIEVANWGTSRLDPAPDQTVFGDYLSIKNIIAGQLVFGIAYVC